MKFRSEPAALPKVDPSLRALSAAEVSQSLRQIDGTLAPAVDSAPATMRGPYFFCPKELLTNEVVRVQSGGVEVGVEVDDRPCGGSDKAEFKLSMSCPGEDDRTISDTTVQEFGAASGFNFTGAWEKRCLGRGDGEATYSQDLKLTNSEQVKVYAVKRSDGQACRVSRHGDGPATIHDCTYLFRREVGADVVELRATAEDLVGHPGDRFYRSGTMHVVLNNWYGKAVFKGEATAPEVELTNGQDTLRLPLGSAP